MTKDVLEERIPVPQGVEASIGECTISVQGAKGKLINKFFYPRINIVKENQSFLLRVAGTGKKQKRVFYTFVAHIKNMLYGVSHGFVYKMKICSGHFPMTVKVEGNTVVVSNFLGEKIPRKASVVEGTRVTISGDTIVIESPDIHAAGQTAANIEIATRIRKRDRRVFQDGVYLTEKPE